MRALGFVVACLMTVAAWAQPLADRVPSDALVYIGWSGADSMGPGYAGSHLKSVIEASNLPQFVSESIPNLMKKLGARDRDVAQFSQMLSAFGGPVWRHPTAIYFGGVDVSDPNAGPVPKFAILCDAKTEGAKLAGLLKDLLAQAPTPFEIKVEEQGGLVVVGAGMKGWGAAAKPASALPASKTFGAALAPVGKEPVAAVYVDAEAIVALVDQMIGQGREAADWAKARDNLGLKGVKRLIFTSGFDGKDWSSQAFVEAPSPRAGLVPSLFDAKPISDSILKTIPQSATVFSAGQLDLGGLFKTIQDTVTRFDARAGQEMTSGLAQVKQQIGLDIQTDLLDCFGHEWGMYVDPSAAGNGMLGLAIVNQPRNAAKLEESLTKLEGMANQMMAQAMSREGMIIQFKTTKINGTTMHHLAIPVIAPTWAIKDGTMYVGLYPQVVTSAIEHAAAKGKSVLENEDFIAVRKRLGGQAGSAYSFANLPKTAPDAYQQIMMISRMALGFADMFGADTPPLVLPPLGKIMPHLSPTGSVTWSDAAGWHYKSVSPFPGSTLLSSGGTGEFVVGYSAIMTSILLPSLNRAREAANRVKCSSNLQVIGQGCHLYANENNFKFPPDLGTMAASQDLTAGVFVCPSGDTGPMPPGLKGDQMAKWINENSHYVYLGKGKLVTAGAEVIIAHEKFEAHNRQGMNMLFADGHVEFMHISSAMEMIEKQTKGK